MGRLARLHSSALGAGILGRAGTDVLKSGGYKISALEIEREMLAHPAVEEVESN